MPSPASATPSFSIEHRALTPLTQLPARVASRLTMTAGAQEERFRLRTGSPVSIGGDVRVVSSAVVPLGLAVCPGTWQRFHAPRANAGRFEYDLVLAAGGTAFADGTDTLVRAPWPGEDEMGLAFAIDPEPGRALTLSAEGPLYQGPLGVQIRLSTTAGRLVGMTTPVVNSGRAILRARRAGSSRSIPVATLPVRDGVFSVKWRAPRGGRWEVYAQYRSESPSNFSDDAMECGLPVVAR